MSQPLLELVAAVEYAIERDPNEQIVAAFVEVERDA